MVEHITLPQFEAIDGAFDALRAMGDFMTCADPRSWIRASQHLNEVCVDALGYDHVSQFEHAQACAADVLTRSLASSTFVLDA